jgi:predicted transcriptional regulator
MQRYVEEQSLQVVAIQKAMKRLQNGEAKFADHKQEGWLESWGTTSEGDPR